MRIRVKGVQYLLLLAVCIFMSSCATQKTYHGVEATNLSELVYGMERIEVEKITGKSEKSYQCDKGSIVTYVYNRGYAGCLVDGTCFPSESDHLQGEIMADVLTFGLYSALEPRCLNPCQKGHLELFFDGEDRLIGVRELPTDRDVYCWGRGNKRHLGYPCNRIYDHPRSSSVPQLLILHIDPEDIPDKICDQFNR